MKKIAIFGPHDRFNYGDFLFPLMLKYALKKKYLINDSQIEYYSIVKADFSKNGAYSSKSYKELKRNINMMKD